MWFTARCALIALSAASVLPAQPSVAGRPTPPCPLSILPALIADTVTSAERDGLSRRPCSTASVIDSSVGGGVAAHTLSEALAGRVAGITVMQSSGVVGTGARVRLRGGSGLLIPRTPLLVIDGVRVDASQSSLGIDIGGQAPSRLDDIPLDEVERIETLRGPSASALYGTDAAGGVIVVTTKPGAASKALWNGYVEGGAATDVTSYPTNIASGPPNYGMDTCTRAGAALGACTAGPLSRWNPLEQASPFRTGARVDGGVSVTGGTHTMSYFAAGTARDDQGPLAPNDLRRYAGRVNLDLRPVPSLRVSARGSHIAGRTSLPVGGTFGINTLHAGLMGNTADDPVLRGYWRNSPASIATIVTAQRIARSLGSVAAEWRALRWLKVSGLVGRELVRRDDSRTIPLAPAYEDPTLVGPFQIQGSQGRDQRTTFATSATATRRFAPSLTSETIVGAERLTRSFRTRDSVFQVGTRSERRSHAALKTIGTYASQRLVWGSRVFAVGVRHDDGDKRLLVKPATYWSARSEWDLSDETFFHPSKAVSALALRAGYGVAGDSRPLDVVLSAAPRLPPSAGEPSVVPRFAPERVSELEIGVDLRSFYERLGVDATWYRQRSTDSYERGCCIGPFGYDDGGGWHTNGIEISLTAKAFETLTSEWITRVTFAGMSNRYDRSPSNNSRVLDGSPFFGGGRRRLIRGYPIAGVWGRPVVGRDANGDGVIVPSEITEAADSVYLGSSIPTREVGVATSLTVFRRVTVFAQLDHHGGFKALNETEAFRCGVGTCAALYDPNASVAEQTRAVFEFGEGPGFTERADFTRLRELAVTWVLARPWLGRHGVERLALSVAGRNLWISTPYSGLDPEVNMGGQSTFGTTEYFTLPLARSMVIRLDIRH